MKKALLVALLAVGIQQAHAEKEPTLMEAYPGADHNLIGDGSIWEVAVSTVYKTKEGKFVTKPAYTLKTTSGKCAFGRDQVLDMKGDFQVKVADQFCVGKERGNKAKEIFVGGWMTSPYPNDAADWPTQDEAHFVYGEPFSVRLDQTATAFKTKVGVFEYTARKL